MPDYGTGSFSIANIADPATSPGDEGPEESIAFVFQRIHLGSGSDDVFCWDPGDGAPVEDHTTETVLPYIEQRVGEADDGGFVINWSSGDGLNGDSVGVIAIITPTEHDDGGIVVNWTPSATGESERMAGFCANGQTSGDGSSQGIIINWASGNGSSHDAFPTETIHPLDVHSSFDLLL